MIAAHDVHVGVIFVLANFTTATVMVEDSVSPTGDSVMVVGVVVCG